MPQKFFKNRKNILISLLVLLFLTTAAFYTKNSKKDVDLEKQTVSILQKCNGKGNTPNSLDMGCVYEDLETLITRDTIDPILATLEKTFSNQKSSLEYGTTSCHNPAHIVGEIAYEKGISYTELLNTCSTRCGFGCLHGGFMARFKEGESEFLDSFKDVCYNLDDNSDKNVRSCLHIVGHGLNEFYREDIEATSEKCLEFETEKGRWHCFSGVRMEYLVGSPGNPPKIEYSVDNLLAFCKRFPQEYQDECFAEAPFYALKIAGDVETSVKICDSLDLDEITRRKCAAGAGTEIVTMKKDTPEEVYQYCKRHGEFVNDCIWGATDLFSSEWDYLRNGAKLCNMIEGSFRRECYAYFGEGLERWYDKKFRKKICGELSQTEESYCLSEPKDSRDYLKAPR